MIEPVGEIFIKTFFTRQNLAKTTMRVKLIL